MVDVSGKREPGALDSSDWRPPWLDNPDRPHPALRAVERDPRTRVLLDLISDRPDTERTRLEMVPSKPLPFPPEPLAWVGIQLTHRALARQDRTGRRGLWLRALDRLGLGFDS